MLQQPGMVGVLSLEDETGIGLKSWLSWFDEVVRGGERRCWLSVLEDDVVKTAVVGVEVHRRVVMNCRIYPNGTNGVGVAWKVTLASRRWTENVVFGVGSSAGRDLNLTRVEVNRRRRYRGLRYRGRMECELQCK